MLRIKVIPLPLYPVDGDWQRPRFSHFISKPVTEPGRKFPLHRPEIPVVGALRPLPVHRNLCRTHVQHDPLKRIGLFYLADEFTESKAFVQLPHQDQNPIGRHSRSLKCDSKKPVEQQWKIPVFWTSPIGCPLPEANVDTETSIKIDVGG